MYSRLRDGPRVLGKYPIKLYLGKCLGHLENFEPFFYIEVTGVRKIPIENLEKLPKVRSNVQSAILAPQARAYFVGLRCIMMSEFES